ncbi:kinase-like protein [Aspergillus ellipticus CBS 707.79]|uniref:Kinase-like protein n=1 Tax=Aspergillus ellipticus CBS 707.79 TaxID=1448320 RepID=A0A319DFD9_9EURO|nr:kinase-like protein [Aspergillus ellipticus CBS 707.79]
MSLPSLGPDARRLEAIRHILSALRTYTKQRSDESKSFICRQDLRKVWSNADLIPTLLYPVVLSSDDITRIQRSLIAILSILITIDATTCLARFHELFLDGDIRDQNLPLEKHEIHSFLPENSAPAFLFRDHQYKFCPVKIQCSQSHALQEIRPRCRLPFEDTRMRLGSGGFGIVDLVEIAPRYLKFDENLENPDPYRVACKRFERDNRVQDFDKELKNLKRFRDATNKDEHILQYLTAIQHGPYNYIIFPYAEKGDLNHFLLDGNGSYDPHVQFPNIPAQGDSCIFKPLLHQCWMLASALEWLHNGIQIGPETFRCAHMDIKPDNILIMKDASSIVGKWVISDFGISIQQPAVDISYYQQWTIRIDPIRLRGTYLPPEAIRLGAGAVPGQTVGRKGDIWSYGCVFSEVLAWAVGRQQGVDDFLTSREGETGNDSFWEQGTALSLAPEPHNPRLRSSVAEWLDNLRTPTSETVVGVWAQSIKEILVIDIGSRPGAKRLKKIVGRVYRSCDSPSDDYLRDEITVTPPENLSSDFPPYTPDPSIVSSTPSVPSYLNIRASHHWESSRDRLCIKRDRLHRILQHHNKDKVVTCLSRTRWQDSLPTALVSRDRVEIVQLQLVPRSETSIIPKQIALPQKMKIYIGDITNKLCAMEPANIRFVSSVAVSPRGIFAFMKDKDIILLRYTHVQDTSTQHCLHSSSSFDQTFTHVIFNDEGSLLFAWARCSKEESLYVWKVTEDIHNEPDFVIHFSLVRYVRSFLRRMATDKSKAAPCL